MGADNEQSLAPSATEHGVVHAVSDAKAEAVETIEVVFSGPFRWLPGADVQCLSEADIGRACGVYVWTVPTAAGELVYYVGETGRGFAQRMREHLREQLSGWYRLYEPATFLRGEKQLLWRGLYGRGGEPDVSEFVRQLPDLAPALVEVVHTMRFHVAPTSCDKRVRQRIEAALAQCLYKQEGVVGTFQDEGILFRPRWPSEDPISVSLRWRNPPLGAPELLEV